MPKKIDFTIKEKQPGSELQAAYRAVFGGPAGQLVLADLVEKCGVFGVNIAAEALNMARVEGKRAIGLYIVSQAGGLEISQMKGVGK